MSQVALTFPDSTYSSSNKPSIATLKSDLLAIETAHNDLDTNAVTATSTTVMTNKTLTLPVLTNGAISFHGQQGNLVNGKISVTDSGSGIVLAVKTFAGIDPSSSDPVNVIIDGTARTLTAALSVTVADGANTMNLGSAELATKEVDLFAHLFWKASDSSLVLGFARFAGEVYSDFSSTATNEKYIAVSAAPAATDTCVVIGRFAATLSAGAGYTWSVPTYTAKNLIQRPVYETRVLDILPVFAVASGTAPTYTASVYKYKVIGTTVQYWLNNRNTVGGTAGSGANPLTFQTPFDPSATASDDSGGLGHGSVYENAGTICGTFICRSAANKAYARNVTNVAGISANDQSDANRIFQAHGSFVF